MVRDFQSGSGGVKAKPSVYSIAGGFAVSRAEWCGLRSFLGHAQKVVASDADPFITKAEAVDKTWRQLKDCSLTRKLVGRKVRQVNLSTLRLEVP